jgi:hypothetical protein
MVKRQRVFKGCDSTKTFWVLAEKNGEWQVEGNDSKINGLMSSEKSDSGRINQ